MSGRPVILCPTDFSDASRSAVRYAHAIAEHVGARLMILTVEDRLLAEAMDLRGGTACHQEDTRRELGQFVRTSLGASGAGVGIDLEAAVGKPADEILRVARQHHCDLIVMSSQGATRMRRLFFGSTTERVLRETTVPVLVTPADAASLHHGDIRFAVRRVLVPVDLSPGSLVHVQAARAVCDALRVPLLLAHVVEPVRSPIPTKQPVPSLELERKTRAEDALAELIATLPRRLHPEALTAHGDPAEEIAKIARDRDAGLIVMGLHASPPGRHIGSVTYRVLCLAHALVLALPGAVRALEERDTTDVSMAV
jgi:nucleotide-binding universal stress UspA family protein